MPEQHEDPMPSASQWPHAAIVAVIAVVVVALVTMVAIYHYRKASDAMIVLGPVIGSVSSLVAAYFGLRAGSLAQQKTNEGRGGGTPPAGGAGAPVATGSD